jgi:hypothetical protein
LTAATICLTDSISISFHVLGFTYRFKTWADAEARGIALSKIHFHALFPRVQRLSREALHLMQWYLHSMLRVQSFLNPSTYLVFRTDG